MTFNLALEIDGRNEILHLLRLLDPPRNYFCLRFEPRKLLIDYSSSCVPAGSWRRMSLQTASAHVWDAFAPVSNEYFPPKLPTFEQLLAQGHIELSVQLQMRLYWHLQHVLYPDQSLYAARLAMSRCLRQRLDDCRNEEQR